MYTDIKLAGSDYILIREQDVIAIMPQKSEGQWGESVRAAREFLHPTLPTLPFLPDAQADDIPNMKPLADRVLIKVRGGERGRKVRGVVRHSPV